MRIFLTTLGCKVNQYESQVILEIITNNGYTKENNLEKSDIIIINSCAVTSESYKKVKKILNQARKKNPLSIIVLLGCIPQALPEKTLYLVEADIIIGNSNKFDILKYIEKFIITKEKIIDIIPFNSCQNKLLNSGIKKFNKKTRAFVKIEDGCDKFCSYCIIPYARGTIQSKSIETLSTEVKGLVKTGFKEIVLIGINLCAYGQDIGITLCDAIETVCNIPEVQRVRLGSLDPDQLNLDIIQRLSKQKKLCPQFHLSLQSGCDQTLQRMSRRYITQEFEKIVDSLRNNFENSSITTDIMVGFAGESDEEFKISLDFVRKIKFAQSHVFPYSIRPGTKAATFDNHVDDKIKKIRSKEMLDLTDNLKNEFLRNQIGSIQSILFEKINENGLIQGYSENYTLVCIDSEENIIGKILNVKITDSKDGFCIGKLI